MRPKPLIVVLLALLTAILLVACRTSRQSVTVPLVKSSTESLRTGKADTVWRTLYQRDSVYMRDSVYVDRSRDTLLIERWHTAYRDRWHADTLHRIVTDTCRYVRCDSIPYPVTVETTKEVERNLTWWESFRLNAFWWLFGLALCTLIYVFRNPIVRLLTNMFKVFSLFVLAGTIAIGMASLIIRIFI